MPLSKSVPANDADLSVAFDSVDFSGAIDGAGFRALCFSCRAVWAVVPGSAACPSCRGLQTRILLEGDLRPNETREPRPLRALSADDRFHLNELTDDSGQIFFLPVPKDNSGQNSSGWKSEETLEELPHRASDNWKGPGSWFDSLEVFSCALCCRLYLDHSGRGAPQLCVACDTGDVRSSAGRHGLRGAVDHRCRCSTCLSAVLRSRDWVNRRIQGETLQSIADSYGVTREYVRQCTARLEPSAPWDAHDRAVRIQLEEERQFAAWALEEVRAAAIGPCPVCGQDVPNGRRRYCSESCRQTWDVLRFHLDDDRRDKHRQLVARWAVENPESVSDLQVRHARRVLSGASEVLEDRRWLIEGSEPFKAAVEAVMKGWPLGHLLPDPIQRQIAAYLGHPEADAESRLTFDILQDLYVTKRLTPSAIAAKHRTDAQTVRRLLESLGIPLRPVIGGSGTRHIAIDGGSSS